MNLADTAPQTPATGRGAGRVQTLVVLLVTAAVIALVAVLMGGRGFGQTDGVSQVTLSANVADAAPTVGAIPPGFTATTYDSKTVSLAQFAGKPVWLTFGASWCPDCRSEAPDVEAAYQKYQAEGLNILAVFISESPTDVGTYAARAGLTFPIAVDQQTVIASQFRTMGIPTHFFIGADGRIKDIKLGALDPATMDSEIQAILAK
jgi:cytochrome c biogenesis protein CcmG, thiol:disulfide interchange protein DsbE